jgi:hypothetical protein
MALVSSSGFTPNKEGLWRLEGDVAFIDDNIIAMRGGAVLVQMAHSTS